MKNYQTLKYEGYIYCIENSINSHKYIGQTRTTIKRRWDKHLSDAKKSQQVLYRAMRKYGIENFSIRVLYTIECDTQNELKDALDKKEILVIQEYNEKGLNYII